MNFSDKINLEFKKRVNMIFKLILAISLMFSGLCHAAAFQTNDKLYIDGDTFKTTNKGDEFYIHIGNNVWLVTNTIHRDISGLYAYEANLSKSMNSGKADYQRKWKCPYCYQYWDIGKPCGNPSCPSKYK